MKLTTKLKKEIVAEAKQFITEKYNCWNVHQVEHTDIFWSKTCRFAQFRPAKMGFFKSKHYPSNRKKIIRLNVNLTEIGTYKKKTVGLYADWFEVGLKLSLVSSLIHELTHLVQWEQDRKYSEVETTQNQVDHLKENYPEYYSKLKPLQDNRRKPVSKNIPNLNVVETLTID